MANTVNTQTNNQNTEALYSSVLRSKQQKARLAQLTNPQTEKEKKQSALKPVQNRQKQSHLRKSFSFSKPTVPENITQNQTKQEKERASAESIDKEQTDEQRKTSLLNKKTSSDAKKALTSVIPPQYKPIANALSGNLPSSSTDIQKLGTSQASILLYGSLFSFTDFGASLIPLNLWMYGFLKRFLGPFQGPPLFPSKLAGQLIVALFTFLYGICYFVVITFLCLVVYFILNPEQAIVEFTYTFFQNIL